MLRTGEQIGPYTLTSKLGQGSFGVVWLAERHTSIAITKVALKIPLDDDVDLETIKLEATLWVQASGHPNVVPIIEADVYDRHIVIASEYAPDGSLETWVKPNGGKAPSIEAAMEIVSGILAGLEHLHARHIIHRDLKPGNILLQGQTPRLTDFGISRILKSTSQSTMLAGTPVYMAPEAFDRKRNEQTDIWSVGVIFYQLLSGRLPFPQSDLASLMAAIVTKEPDPLPTYVSESLREIVAGALQKNTAYRYKSATEMRLALRNALQTAPREKAEETKTLTAERPKRTLPSPSQHHSKYLLFGLLGVVVFVGVLAVIWWKPNFQTTSDNLRLKERELELQEKELTLRRREIESKNAAVPQERRSETLPPIDNPLPPSIVNSSSNYSGSVGGAATTLYLSWNKNNTVTGSFYYNDSPQTVYMLSGTNFRRGEAEIKAYYGNQVAATMKVYKSIGGNKVCWSGSFYTSQGGTSPISFCRYR